MNRLAVLALLLPLAAACGSGRAAPARAHVIERHVTAAEVTSTHICEAIPNRANVLPVPGKPCHSPDGVWAAIYRTHISEPRSASLRLARHGSRSVRMYRSRDACCVNVTWAKPHTLVFIDDYQLFSLDPVTQKATLIDGDSSNAVVSPDGQWVAFWNDDPHAASTVGVKSVDGATCFIVPHLADETDTGVGFSRDSKSVVVGRGAFDLLDQNGVGPTGPSHSDNA